MKTNDEHKPRAGVVVFALLVIAAGGLLQAFNSGALPPAYKPIVFSWQMLLVALGVISLFLPYKRLSGGLLILLGAFLLLPKFGIDRLAFLRGSGWAVLITCAGILILCRTLFGKHIARRRCGFHRRKPLRQQIHDAYAEFQMPNEEAGIIDRYYIFGNGKEKVSINGFRGGDINCVFSGAELDFREAQLAEGVNILEVNIVFGGITLFIPPHWNVEIKQVQAFGAFVDKRPPASIEVSDNRQLLIKGSAVFGGGEIR
jgi:predicted membrane protein